MNRMVRSLFCVLLAAMAFALPATGPARAAQPEAVAVGADVARVALDGRFALSADDNPALGLDDVIRNDRFQFPVRPHLAPGVRWYRVLVTRAAGAPSDWLLAFGEPDIDDVRVFVPRADGGFAESRLGRHIPNAELTVAGRQHIAKVSLPEGEAMPLYIRLASRHKIRFEDAALWQPEALLSEETRQATMLALRFGMMALLVVGYALFGAWVRDAPMLLYAAYVATILCRGLTHTGLAALVFPQSGTDANYLMSAVGLVGAVSAFAFMWDRILDLRNTLPTMHRVYTVVGWFMALSVALMDSPAFPLIARSAQTLMLAASITSVVLALIMVRRHPGNVLLRFYVVAFLPLVAVGAVQLAFPWLPFIPIQLGRSMDNMAITTHIAILGVALAYRLGRMQRDHARVQAELSGEREIRLRLRAFIDMVTHEFKTPLAVIDSAVQVVELQTPGRPEIATRVTTIRRAIKRLVALIETCLAGERYETMEIKLAAASPAAIAEQAAERNQMQDSAAITVTTGDVPERCLVDAELLGIALDTLIDNARRYAPEAQTVDITAAIHDGHLELGVHDRGPGVPADEAGRIFEKYYRCAATASTVGTGVGLHLVKTIAELHGGSVCYAPRPGGGASFILSIPAPPLAI